MKNKKILLIFVVVIILISIFNRLESLEIHNENSYEMSFYSSEKKLSGTLYIPDSDPPYDVVFFIHGDGPQNRTANGGYNFLINHFLDEDIACFSYDKAGIAASEGDWLSQTMEDRAKEVSNGLKVIKSKASINKIGVIAFSQGGWVASELSKKDIPVDFIIVVGGAIDWMDQHIYYEEKLVERRSYTESQKKSYLSYVKKYDEFIEKNDYNGYAAFVSKYDYEEPMSKKRFDFVHLNLEVNAIEGIKKMKVPFLGIFGGQDQNVNVVESYNVYNQLFKDMGKENFELVIYPDATHSLLKSKYEKKGFRLIFDSFLIGEDIFVPEYFDTLTMWIKELP